MRISIVIPNYNGASLLKKNIPHVLEAADYYSKETHSLVDIVVVDDDSRDNPVEYIKDQTSKIKNTDKKSKIILRFLQNEKNIGFASTVNKGVKEAQGGVIVLLNSDVEPEKDFLIPLLVHFKEEKVFAVGCLDKSIEGSKTVLRGRGIGRWQRGFLVHKRGEVDKTDTLWVNGGSGAFKKEIWNKLGGFNSIYSPFYWEDIDLSYRAQKAGYKVVFEPKSVVIHEHEKGSIKAKYNSSQIKTTAYRNQFIFVWMNATDLDLQLLHIFWLPYHFLMAIKNLDWSFFKGFLLAIIKLPQILESSAKIKKSFIKSDKEVIKNIEYYV